jgi:hypothetical protein
MKEDSFEISVEINPEKKVLPEILQIDGVLKVNTGELEVISNC